jgi:dihydrodipicolinate synthase/N-acetylneuraminate lyase
MDLLVRCGVREQLDGIYAIAPHWAVGIVEAADRGDWEEAARRQRRMTALRSLVPEPYRVDPACTVILNALGVPGRMYPRPMRPLDPDEAERLLAEEPVRRLLAEKRNG